MEYRYEVRVEEARTISQRNRRDQVRLMMLVKEADEHNRLEDFAAEINLSMSASLNYLSAYDRFVGYDLLPAILDDADRQVPEAVYEVWKDIFDPTENDSRYANVDRKGVDEAVEELGLKGSTKAYDIAKNPKSLQAAILGDKRAAEAALQAIENLADRSTPTRQRVQRIAHKHWRDEMRPPRERSSPLEDQRRVERRVSDMHFALKELYELDVPDHMVAYVIEHVVEAQQVLENTLVVLRAKLSLEQNPV